MLHFGNIDAENASAAGQVTSVLHAGLMWDVRQLSLKAGISEKL